MSFLKKIFRKKADSPVIEGKVSEPLIPMVTNVDADGEIHVFDAEGSEWVITRSGELVYLSGDEGLVQIQFRIEQFRYLLTEAEQRLL